jgi:hypothetical protein
MLSTINKPILEYFMSLEIEQVLENVATLAFFTNEERSESRD